MTQQPDPTAIYDAIAAFQRTHRLPGLQHAQIRGLLAEHLARALPAVSAVAPATGQTAPELTAEEARNLVDELGLQLYRAQDALAFVEECCVIADREGRQPTTADVREWLKGARCGRQVASDATDRAVRVTAAPVKQRADCTELEWAEQERARFERLYTRETVRADKAEARAAAMERAMESTAADALKHRGCHRDLMAQCLRAERAEAELERLRTDQAGEFTAADLVAALRGAGAERDKIEAQARATDRATVLRDVFDALVTGAVAYDPDALQTALDTGGAEGVAVYVQTTIGAHVRHMANEAGRQQPAGGAQQPKEA
jgi:hypothetical protein